MRWELRRVKVLFRIVNGSTPSSAEPAFWNGDIRWVTPDDLGQLRGHTIFDTRRHLSEAGYRNCGTTLVPIGSLVLSTRAPIGHLAIAGVELCTNQGCRSLVFRTHGDALFFYYVFTAAKEKLVSRGEGTTFSELSNDALGNVRIPFPPVSEQHTIANYLDRETARIDTMIAAKEKLLDLIEEKRRALITRAVTKGLDSAVPMKESGVSWLDKIPAHWKTLRIKHVAHIYYGLSQPPEYVSEGSPFVRATNIQRGNMTREGLVYVDEDDLPESRVIRLREGDIIVVRSGAYTGDSALVTEDWVGAVAGYDMVVRLHSRAIPKFLAMAMLCQYILEAQIDPLRQRAAQPHLNAEELGNITFVLPSPEEQSNIVEYVRGETAKLDALRLATERTIILLKERRASLISALVTGHHRLTRTGT